MEFNFQKKEEISYCSILLESAASNDLIGFKEAVKHGYDGIDESSFWYGKLIGSKKMGFASRTPLMISAMYGNTEVVSFILSNEGIDTNKVSSSDGASALHCAVTGGSSSSIEIVKLLLDAGADPEITDSKGNRPVDAISALPASWRTNNSLITKKLEILLNGDNLKGFSDSDDQLQQKSQRESGEKKEYPVDLSLPDIKNGIYSTDEFRMYSFKVKPCSRAYTHDWTECPFVHPGENARRRDPKKYHYTCVPCPEFRKGSCKNGDNCEYAHGVFESWLHPAQYRTRLCKDETGCNRRVCFFAHTKEELRPLYPSTGSGIPSPRSTSPGVSSFMDLTAVNSFTPPMSPPSSPMGTPLSWSNPAILPNLQLPRSRLKTALSARDVELEMEMNDLEQRQHQLMDEISALKSQSSWTNPLTTAAAISGSSTSVDYSLIGTSTTSNIEGIYGSSTLAPSLISQIHGLPPKSNAPIHNMSASSPFRASSFGMDQSSMAAAVLSSRAAMFSKRSQSFCDRGLAGSPTLSSNALPYWGSPDGKLDWAVRGEELNKLRKSSSFALRGNNGGSRFDLNSDESDEPDVSWVQSLVKDVPNSNVEFEELQYSLKKSGLNQFGSSEMLPSWVEQLYMEPEPMVA